MKRLTLSFLLALCLATAVRAGQPLVLGYGGTSLSRISIAILQDAYARIGIDTESKWLPAARSLFMADAGQTDGEVNRIAAIAPDHPNLIRIDVPINRVEGIALTCGKAVKADLDAISHMRIGIKIGNLYAERLTRNMPTVVKKATESTLIDLLLADRLDVLIVDRFWAQTLKRESRYGCLVINDPPLVTIPLYHYLHKRHADIVPAITRVLREMYDSGEMEAFRDRVIKSQTGS